MWIIRVFRVLIVAATVMVELLHSVSNAEDKPSHVLVTDVLYRTEDGQLSDLMKAKCRLDLQYPSAVKDFATVVWFHGGGLTGGKRSIPPELMRNDLAVVAVSYRLHPDVTAPAYIEDAAAAVAWVFDHIAEYGGSADRIVVSGHSAGGYLTSMIGFERKWLAAHKIDANRIAGLAPLSGQMITHFTIRKENGLPDTQPVINEYAPVHHIRKDSPPILLITGDRERELLARYEENAYAWRMLKLIEHPDVTLHELGGYDHGGMAKPAFPLLLKFVDRVTKSSGEAKTK